LFDRGLDVLHRIGVAQAEGPFVVFAESGAGQQRHARFFEQIIG